MRIQPARRIYGALSLPGDKAISHRAAIVAALAEGTSRVENFSTSDDCAATLTCLRELGVHAWFDAGVLQVEGAGLAGLRAPRIPLDCRNSGSTMRMLAGVLAGQSFESILIGDESLGRRPMKRIIEPLEMMGARVEAMDGCAPLRITPCRKPLKAISYLMPVASAQVKSCILLAGLYAAGETQVIESSRARTRDHTERMLRRYGARVYVTSSQDLEGSPLTICIEPPVLLRARDFRIPGDISSAAFLIAAACIMPGSQLSIKGVGLNPTRTGFLSALGSLGADVRAQLRVDGRGSATGVDEACGDITVTGGASLIPANPSQSNIIKGALIPQLIDELPMLAVVGTQVAGGLTIRDAAELRLKETDRIAATVKNLRAMGAEVEEHEDGLTIPQRTPLRGARIDAHNDHRIAMAFTIAALLAEGDSEIVGAECVAVSFPEFYTLLESVTER
jgi:3-phosphoshikimate 1-carboxyvinyltransferase